MLMAIAFGLAAGLAGATAWAALVYSAHLEVGYLAWGIGVLVGFAMFRGMGRGSKSLALAAVAITAGSILFGKYAAVEISINKEVQQIIAGAPELTDEYMTSLLADDWMREATDNGKAPPWPDGVDPTTAET